MIDTHTHLDGEEFIEDIDQVVSRAKDAGVSHVMVPGINRKSCQTVMALCSKFHDYAYPMLGLHPEDVDRDWEKQLKEIRLFIDESIKHGDDAPETPRIIGIGEVGLDYYWSREYEDEQLSAFEKQVEWSIELQLPLMIHCRKAQNEMVHLLRQYEKVLPGGVFHCFTGNAREAEELLRFERFALGIGGVLTFKKSHLPEVLPEVVPLNRIVLETDSPYMAPVPHRGKRNESSFVAVVCEKLAECYSTTPQEISSITDSNVKRIFKI